MQQWNQIQVLGERGLSEAAIARKLGLDRETVAKWHGRSAPLAITRSRVSKLDAFWPYLTERLEDFPDLSARVLETAPLTHHLLTFPEPAAKRSRVTVVRLAPVVVAWCLLAAGAVAGARAVVDLPLSAMRLPLAILPMRCPGVAERPPTATMTQSRRWGDLVAVIQSQGLAHYREAHRDQFAGAYIDANPPGQVVIRVTGDRAAVIQALNLSPDLSALVAVKDAAFSEHQLATAAAAVDPAQYLQRGIPLVAVGADLRINRVRLVLTEVSPRSFVALLPLLRTGMYCWETGTPTF